LNISTSKELMATKKKREVEDLGELISISEAARLRGVSPQAIDRLLMRGRLEAIEIGGRRFLRRPDVVNFKPGLAGRRRKTEN
jgi:excisionase family DNA binding protein